MPTVYPKEFFKQANSVQKASCFVLMPFDPKFTEVYDTIKETLESDILNIQCNRADDFHQPHIIETILKGIVKAEFVLADLTQANANVFYELGLAHNVKDIDKVIILTQDMTFVPFDLTQFRCIVYEQSIAGSRKLKDELTKTLNDATKNSFRLRLKENKTTPFEKKLVGNENFLYEMGFEAPYIGHDAIKLQIHFTQLAVNKLRTKLATQYLYLSEDHPEAKIENIPWSVTLTRTEGSDAIISIDKT